MSENNNNTSKITEYDKLVVDIRNNITTRLTDLMSKLLNSAQEDLFNLSEAADNNEEQTRYFELMNQLRVNKPVIASDFDKNIKEFLIPAKDYDEKQVEQKSDEESELSLIDQDEMEGMVLVKGIGERASSRYREPLSHLEARLEHLALQTPTIFTKNALVPVNICQAFNDALGEDFDSTNKKILFGMFDVEVASKLESLYDSINTRLIDAGVLPQIKLHTQKTPSRPRPKPQQGAQENIDDVPQDDFDGAGAGYAGASGPAGGGVASGGGPAVAGGGGPAGVAGSAGGGSNISGFAMTAPPGGTYRHANPNIPQSATEGGGTAGYPEAAGGGGNEASATGGPASGSGYGGNEATGGNTAGGAGSYAERHSGEQAPPVDGAQYQHYTAGMPASQVGRVLGNYIGGAPLTPGSADESSKSHAEFFPSSTPQHFGHHEIIQALSSLQSLPQFDQPETDRFDAEAIKQAVLAEIAKTSGGAVTKRINQIAEKTIDFIELIFDAIIEDEDISDAVKTLLLRLQIPIIKASMSDQEFFIYDDHPARALLDTIADVGVGVTDHKDEMYLLLDKTISSILGEYDLTTETFQNALDNLNTVIQEKEDLSRAKEEEEQKQLLRKHARATVLKALRATTTGKALPEAVHPLILKRWPTLMFNHYLSNGKENNAWVNLVLTLRHIVESVQPIITATDLTKLIAEKDELFETTEDYLNISSNSKKDVQNIMAAYRETLQEHIDDANFSEEEVSVAEEVISNAEPVEEAPIEEEIADKTPMPSNIMPGMWFQVYMGEDNVPRRCKLSVIIVEDENLMFVNHKGELITEKSFDEFNNEVANETTKMIMGHSAFDHAFKSVINRLN